jgi:hypothetical protein
MYSLYTFVYGHLVKMRNSGPVHALFHPLD